MIVGRPYILEWWDFSLSVAWSTMKRIVLVFGLVLAPVSFVIGAEPKESIEVAVGRAMATFRRVSSQKYQVDYPDYYFLETEVTNRLYREYLRAVNGHKDDVALVAEKSKAWQKLKLKRQKAERRIDEDLAKRIGGPIVESLRTTTAVGTSVQVDISGTDYEDLEFQSLYKVSSQASLWQNDDFPAGLDEHPVTFLAPAEAMAFCKWLSERHPQLGLFRLPTWNEWMIAAYGKSRSYPWGDQWDAALLHTSHGLAWKARRLQTEPVKSLPRGRTPEGLYGILGNASEYLADEDSLNGEYFNLGSRWMGGGFDDNGNVYASTDKATDNRLAPREDYWGYRHESEMHDQAVGFRVLLDPMRDPELLKRPRVFAQGNNAWRTEAPPEPARETAPAGETDKTPATPGR